MSLDGLVVDLDATSRKFHSDRGLGLQILQADQIMVRFRLHIGTYKLVPCESTEEVRFSNTTTMRERYPTVMQGTLPVSDEHYFEQEIVLEQVSALRGLPGIILHLRETSCSISLEVYVFCRFGI